MFKHLRGERSYVIWPNPKKSSILIILINKEPILTSTLAAGIVQDCLLEKAREVKRRQLEATPTATSTAQARNSSVS